MTCTSSIIWMRYIHPRPLWRVQVPNIREKDFEILLPLCNKLLFFSSIIIWHLMSSISALMILHCSLSGLQLEHLFHSLLSSPECYLWSLLIFLVHFTVRLFKLLSWEGSKLANHPGNPSWEPLENVYVNRYIQMTVIIGLKWASSQACLASDVH